MTSGCPDVFLLLCHPLLREPSLELCLFCLLPDSPPEGRENCALAFLEACLKCFDIRILTEGLGVTRGQSLWNLTELQGPQEYIGTLTSAI